jgi:hypothetical protein
MNPHIQQILHDITVRITKLEEAQQPKCEWQSTQEKSKIETVPAQGTLLPQRKCENCGEFGSCCQMQEGKDFTISKHWVGLTDDEVDMLGDKMKTWSIISLKDIYIAIEAKLKDKNL